MKLVAYALQTGSPRRDVQYSAHNRDARYGNRRNVNTHPAVLLLLPATSERATENLAFLEIGGLAGVTMLVCRLDAGSGGKEVQQLAARSRPIGLEPPAGRRFFAFPRGFPARGRVSRVPTTSGSPGRVNEDRSGAG